MEYLYEVNAFQATAFLLDFLSQVLCLHAVECFVYIPSTFFPGK